MSGAARLTAFAVLLAAAFGAAAGFGAVVKPSHPAAPDHESMDEMGGLPLGLAVSDGDYALAPASFAAAADGQTRLRFRIVDAKGRVVRDGFEVEAQRRLHLIVVRRDLTGYQHLHPTQRADGTWSVPLTVRDPGAYRVFADFQIDGRKHVLAADLTVPGAYSPVPLPPPASSATVDGDDVRLTAPALHAGQEAELEFAVSRGGRPVAALQPYLGAMGHLVALRQGDLGYLHVHPHDGSARPGAIRFAATFPSAGRYRLFLQFKTNGTVHAAAFTVEVTP